MAHYDLTLGNMLSNAYVPKFSAINILILINDVFSNITSEFSSDYFIHGNFYPGYSEKMCLKKSGLLYKSEASLQTLKPKRTPVNTKWQYHQEK